MAINPTSDQKLTVSGGSKLLAEVSTSYTGLISTSLSINSDTTFTTITGKDNSGTSINFITDSRYLWSAPVAGTLLICADGHEVNAVEFSAGNVCANNF